ncbi:hypothetical protein CYMTET_13507, partial [Cymbomonas tetramitiformis]
ISVAEAGQLLFHRGCRIPNLLLLLDGRVEYSSTVNSARVVEGWCEAGQVIGCKHYAFGTTAGVSYHATTKCTFAVFSFVDLQRINTNYPRIGFALMLSLLCDQVNAISPKRVRVNLDDSPKVPRKRASKKARFLNKIMPAIKSKTKSRHEVLMDNKKKLKTLKKSEQMKQGVLVTDNAMVSEYSHEYAEQLLKEILCYSQDFRMMTREDIHEVAYFFPIFKREKGCITMRRLKQSECCLLVLKGSFDVVANNKMLASVGEGSFIGEVTLFNGLASSADIVALTDSIVMVISRSRLQHFVLTSPKVGLKLLALLSHAVFCKVNVGCNMLRVDQYPGCPAQPCRDNWEEKVADLAQLCLAQSSPEVIGPGLTMEDLGILAHSVSFFKASKGELIIEGENPGSCLILILRGRVQTEGDKFENGLSVGRCIEKKRGGLVGKGCFLHTFLELERTIHKPQAWQVISDEDMAEKASPEGDDRAKLAVLSQDNMRQLYGAHPELAARLLLFLGKQWMLGLWERHAKQKQEPQQKESLGGRAAGSRKQHRSLRRTITMNSVHLGMLRPSMAVLKDARGLEESKKLAQELYMCQEFSRFWFGFSMAEIEIMLKDSVTFRLQKGDVLFAQGEPSDWMGIVLQGGVQESLGSSEMLRTGELVDFLHGTHGATCFMERSRLTGAVAGCDGTHVVGLSRQRLQSASTPPDTRLKLLRLLIYAYRHHLAEELLAHVPEQVLMDSQGVAKRQMEQLLSIQKTIDTHRKTHKKSVVEDETKILNVMTVDEKRALVKYATLVRLNQDEMVVHSGAEASFVGFILSGSAVLQRRHKDPIFLSKGDMIGGACIVNGYMLRPERSEDVKVSSKTLQMAILAHSDFNRLLLDDPQNGHRLFMRIMQKELDIILEEWRSYSPSTEQSAGLMVGSTSGLSETDPHVQKVSNALTQNLAKSFKNAIQAMEELYTQVDTEERPAMKMIKLSEVGRQNHAEHCRVPLLSTAENLDKAGDDENGGTVASSKRQGQGNEINGGAYDDDAEGDAEHDDMYDDDEQDDFFDEEDYGDSDAEEEELLSEFNDLDQARLSRSFHTELRESCIPGAGPHASALEERPSGSTLMEGIDMTAPDELNDEPTSSTAVSQGRHQSQQSRNHPELQHRKGPHIERPHHHSPREEGIRLQRNPYQHAQRQRQEDPHQHAQRHRGEDSSTSNRGSPTSTPSASTGEDPHQHAQRQYQEDPHQHAQRHLGAAAVPAPGSRPTSMPSAGTRRTPTSTPSATGGSSSATTRGSPTSMPSARHQEDPHQHAQRHGGQQQYQHQGQPYQHARASTRRTHQHAQRQYQEDPHQHAQRHGGQQQYQHQGQPYQHAQRRHQEDPHPAHAQRHGGQQQYQHQGQPYQHARAGTRRTPTSTPSATGGQQRTSTRGLYPAGPAPRHQEDPHQHAQRHGGQQQHQHQGQPYQQAQRRHQEDPHQHAQRHGGSSSTSTRGAFTSMSSAGTRRTPPARPAPQGGGSSSAITRRAPTSRPSAGTRRTPSHTASTRSAPNSSIRRSQTHDILDGRLVTTLDKGITIPDLSAHLTRIHVPRLSIETVLSDLNRPPSHSQTAREKLTPLDRKSLIGSQTARDHHKGYTVDYVDVLPTSHRDSAHRQGMIRKSESSTRDLPPANVPTGSRQLSPLPSLPTQDNDRSVHGNVEFDSRRALFELERRSLGRLAGMGSFPFSKANVMPSTELWRSSSQMLTPDPGDKAKGDAGMLHETGDGSHRIMSLHTGETNC